MTALTRILTTFALSGALAGAPPAPITLSASPTVGFAPFSTRVKVTITRAAVNRAACVEVDGPHYFQSDCWDHVGEGAPLTTWKMFYDMPEGEYAITATVERADHSTSIATVNVIAKGASSLDEF